MPLELKVNTYATVEIADKYHRERGNTEWPDTSPNESKEAALIKATSYIDNLGRGKFKGRKATQEQLLLWPRSDVCDEDCYPIDSDVIPLAVQHATCEAALRIIGGTELEEDYERGGGIKQDVIGPLSTTYFDTAPAETKISVIENLLSGLVEAPLFKTGKPGGFCGTIDLVRA